MPPTPAADHRQVSQQYQHRRGRALTHLGRRRHGADDISHGHRVNLIMWNYNTAYRASKTRAQVWRRRGGEAGKSGVERGEWASGVRAGFEHS